MELRPELVRLNAPGILCIAGSSGSGKSQILKRLLLDYEQVFNFDVERVVIFYFHWQESMFAELRNKLGEKLSLVHNYSYDQMERMGILKRTSEEPRKLLLCFEDTLSQVLNSEQGLDVFFKLGHHTSSFLVFQSQTLFSKERNFREAVSQANYLVVTNCLRQRVSLRILSGQLFADGKFLPSCMQHAALESNYAYLFLDCSQTCLEMLRVRNGLPFTDCSFVVYCLQE